MRTAALSISIVFLLPVLSAQSLFKPTSQAVDQQNPPSPFPPCPSGGSSSSLLPPKFVDELLPLSFTLPVGLAFDSQGRMYVWESGGRVWIVENGVKLAQPLVDVSGETSLSGDEGLIGFALDPAFLTNGSVYLLYSVTHAGTSFGRVSRFQADPATGLKTTLPESQAILIGETPASGIPICKGHSAGSILFGEDGTLLVSTGDSYGSGAFDQECLAAGLLEPKEDVGPFRPQLLDSLAGKILRIDPQSGEGISSNPFFNPAAPKSARSRVWTLGLRQPFRMTLRKGSGSPDPSAADPGTIFEGDVGGGLWEEINVVSGPGRNLGWPIYEGYILSPSYSPLQFANLDQPNPLFGAGSCAQPFFHFTELLAEDSLAPPSWPNPCNPAVQIGPPNEVFVHTRPAVAWPHFSNSEHAQVKTYDASGVAATAALGSPGCPVTGESFQGNCSIGGAWYPTGSFPAEYHNSYFQADFTAGWIRNFVFDSDDGLVMVRDFLKSGGFIVGVASSPADGSLYYLTTVDAAGVEGAIHRIYYNSGDLAPAAVASADPLYGPGPLEVQFSALGSSDPEGDPLSYEWLFSGALPKSLLAQPRRSFPAEDITAQGTIIAKIFSLDPPVPASGASSSDPEVIRDGVFPPVGTQDALLQYATVHFDALGLPDKGADDWIGYEFDRPRKFVGIVFQEGANISALGGWFNELRVQARSPMTGLWQDVGPLDINPSYPGDLLGTGNFIHFEPFEISFGPVEGDGIRLFGPPGGWLQFVSVAELRVLALPKTMSPLPKNIPVQLRTTDAAGNTSCVELFVSLNNSPPAAQITTPPKGSSFDLVLGAPVPLEASVQDAEHSRSSLKCEWQAFLHQNNDHVHPGAPVMDCQTIVSLSPHSLTPGEFLYYEIRLTATDPLGLSTTKSVYLYPLQDCNLNGVEDAKDIASGASLDSDGDGKPDECQSDCNGNGVHDLFDLAVAESLDANGNKIPDECE